MSKFRVGQKLVCIGEKSNWKYQSKFTGFWIWKKQKKAIGPAKGEIVKCLGYHPDFTNSIILEGWPDYFIDVWFRPVQEDVSAIELVNKELCPN